MAKQIPSKPATRQSAAISRGKKEIAGESGGNAQTASQTATDRPPPTQEHIARRAHQIWETEGKPEGAEMRNWYAAEEQLRAESC